MAVAFAELVRPDDRRVIEHRAVAAGLWNRVELLREGGQLFGKPDVDLHQLLLRVLVAIRLVGKSVVTFVDAEPAHAGLADGVRVFERRDSSQVIGESIHEEV